MKLSTRCYTRYQLTTRFKLFMACLMSVLLLIPLLPFSSVPNRMKAQARNMVTRGQNGGDSQVGKKVYRTRPLSHPDAQRVLAATYYSLNNNLSATLMLSNQGPHPISIQPTLYNLKGERFDAPAITLEGNTVGSYDLQKWVARKAASFREGSLQVLYNGMEMELGGVVKMVDEKHSLIFDEELTEPSMMFKSSHLEGVWWLPSQKAETRLIISNTTDAVLPVTASVDSSALKQKDAKTLYLNPHETHVLNVQEIVGKRSESLSNAGGISLTYGGAPGALLARALIQDPAVGYSSVVEFIDPQTAKSVKLNGAGLRTGQVAGEELKQVAVARNVGASSTDLNGRIVYTMSDGSTGVINLPQTHLDPNEVKAIDLAGAIKGSGVSNFTAAGLEFEYTGQPGNVIVSALSVSKSGNQVFRVPLVDASSISSSTGQYPWSIEGTSSTFVYIKNVTDHQQQYTMQIKYAGGAYSLGLKTIEAGQTMALDVRALRDKQVPDAQGRTLPMTATNGQVHWSMDGEETLVLIGRAEQVDLVKGVSMTSACLECCADSWYDFWLDPGNIVGFVGDSGQFAAWQQNQNCYGEILEPFQRFPNNFYSTNPFVAICDLFGFATAQNPGTTNIGASWTVQFWEYDPDMGCRRYNETANPISLCDVLAIQFLDVQLLDSNRKADFLINFATLDIDTCGGERFAIKARFSLPQYSDYCCQDDFGNFVKLSDDNKFEFAPSPIDGTIYDFFGNDTPPYVVIYLRRKSGGGGTTNRVSIHVSGRYQSGESYSGQGSVALQCQ